MTEGDIPWLFYICKKRYSNKYDSVTTEGWFRNNVLKSPVMFLPQRMPNAFCISMLSILPWLPSEVECNVVFICADENCGWEAMKLLRSSMEWAKGRKCACWRLASDTSADLTAFAKRLGVVEISPRYIIHF
jgi:hypothetical protein